MKFKLPDSLQLEFLQARESYAIDIGYTSLKVAYLRGSFPNYSLYKWAILPLGGEFLSEVSPAERQAAVVSKLKEFFAREKVISKNIKTSVAGPMVVVRYVNLPKLKPEELTKTIKFEAEQYIPFNIEEVGISFHLLNETVEDGQKKWQAILVAAKKDLIQSRLDIFNELGLRTVLVDIDDFALANAYNLVYGENPSGVDLLLNIGHQYTNIVIMEQGLPRVVRDIGVAGWEFTKAVQRALSVDIIAAEKLKQKNGLLLSAEEKEQALRENNKEAIQTSSALLTVAKIFLGEVRKSIDFYSSQSPDKSVERILLSGGGARLKNLDRYIGNELHLPTEVFNPLQNIAPEISVEDGQMLTIATGLALRQEKDQFRKQ